MAAIEIKSWQMLPSEGGGSVALSGDRLAVSGQSHLCVWQGQQRLATLEARSPAPGAPRFVGERVHWGPAFLDLVSGSYTWLEEAQPAVWPGGGERPHVYAWSPQGDWLLGSFSTNDPQLPVRVKLFNRQKRDATLTIWEGVGLPPQAAWLGERAAVIGSGDPRVFDYSGRHLADISIGGATIVAIEATTNESRLIVVDLNRAMTLIETETWTILDRWVGPWLHGAVTPEGGFAVALESGGKLHFACFENDRFEPIGRVNADPKTIALALDLDQIATVGGGEVRRATVEVDCAAALTLGS